MRGETKMAKKWTERDGLAAPGGTRGNRDQRADGDRRSRSTGTLGRATLRFLPSAVSGHITTAKSPVNTVPRVHSSAVELNVMH